jgi:CBS domain containing-hemolysin-like protein
MILLSALAVLLVLLLVFLSTFESAFGQLSEVQLRVVLAENEQSFHARFLRELIENRQRFLLTLGLSVHLLIVLLTIVLVTISGRLMSEHSILASMFAMVFAIGAFHQFIPRLLAQNNPEKVMLRLLPVFSTIYNIFWFPAYPIYRALQILKSRSPTTDEAPQGTDEEIQAFIDVGEQAGIIEESEGQLIQSIVELGDKQVRELMTPRTDIMAFTADTSVREALQKAVDLRYSRLPVFGEHLDDIVGIVHLRDLIRAYLSGHENEPVSTVVRPAYFIPETKQAADLLDEMKNSRTHIAVVIDEYGGVAGLVTLVDLVEEVVGEIQQEDKTEPADINEQPDGSFIVRGSTEIRKLELLFDTEIESDDFTTVAGLIIKRLDRLPAVGEGLQFKSLRFEVLDADPRRIRTVRIRRIEPAKQEISPARQAN